uniref:Uncharacterized protein n=1 Tax=Gadus morhua TaxID=8049 RepID=A0A8C5FEL0_GADMO
MTLIITAKFQTTHKKINLQWYNVTPPPTTLMMKPRTNFTTNYITFYSPGKKRTS